MVASGLTGSSQTLIVQGIGEPYGSFAGFEIVNNTLNREGVLPAATPLSIAAGGDAGPRRRQPAGQLAVRLCGGQRRQHHQQRQRRIRPDPEPHGRFDHLQRRRSRAAARLGTISLVMSGSGTQVLAGSNTYTGPTTIKPGQTRRRWLARPTRPSASTAAPLGGTGYLSSVTVNAGGQLCPGRSRWALERQRQPGAGSRAR